MITPFLNDDWFGAWPGRILINRPRGSKSGTNDIMKQLQPVMDVDVIESETEYSIHCDLPGVDKSDVDIRIDDGTITISAEKKNAHENKTATSHHIERSYGSVRRSFRLPSNVTANSVRATFENGVLEVKLPKIPATPASEGVKVPIA